MKSDAPRSRRGLARAVRVALPAVLIVLAGCLGLGAQAAWRAPDFEVTDTDGVTHNLSKDYSGRVLIVDIMATWCKPCEDEMPHLAAIRDAYPEDQVAILSIGGDRSESAAQLAAYRARFDAKWPFARDTDGIIEKLDLSILPKLVIIDPAGFVVYENQGETFPVAMTRVIDAALKRSP